MKDEKRAVPGRLRKGYQATNLTAAMTDVAEGRRQMPRVEKPREMIESLRFRAPEALTAQDHALYEALLAKAREKGVDAPEHTALVPDMLRFLGLEHVDRLKDSLRRLSETTVTYEFEDGEIVETGWIHLITETRLRRRKTGEPDKATITYTIPPTVRQIVLESEHYAKLEILAFPKFSCRYTPRLYPRLALRAGYKRLIQTDEMTWTVDDPQALAEELGFPCSPFRFANFRRDCLDAVMKDVEDHVTRFTARYRLLDDNGRVRGAGSRSPVQKIVFAFTPSQAVIAEAPRRYMTSYEKVRVNAPDPEHERSELPSDVAISKACSLLKRGPDEVSEAWRAVLALAKAEPHTKVAGGVFGGGLLYSLEKHGADNAFGVWVNAQKVGQPLETHRPPARPVPVRQPDPEPVQEPVRPPLSLEECIRQCRDGALDLVGMAEGWVSAPLSGGRLPRHVDDETLTANFDEDYSPWGFLQSSAMPPAFRDAHRDLVKAFVVLRRSTAGHRREAMLTLAQALHEWDAEKLTLAARDIVRKGPQETASISTVGAPKPPAVLRRARASTLGVTELHAEIGYPDPYALMASDNADDGHPIDDHDPFDDLDDAA